MIVQVISLLQNYVTYLQIFNLTQSVNQTTRTRGHIFDWIIHSEDDNILQSSSVTQELTSDHHCLINQLDLSVPDLLSTLVTIRNCKSVDRFQLKQDINS